MDVDPSETPVLRILDVGKQSIFEYVGDPKQLDTELLRAYIKTWKEGGNEDYYRSEPVPEETGGPMTTFVAENLLDYF